MEAAPEGLPELHNLGQRLAPVLENKNLIRFWAKR